MSKKILFLTITIILIAVLVFFLQENFTKQNHLKLIGRKENIAGRIIGVSLSARVLTITTHDNKEINLIIVPKTELFGENNNSVELSYFQRGFDVLAKGVIIDNSVILEELRTVKAPNIVVFSPQSNAKVNEIIKVTGEARVFENQFNIRIISSGKIIYEEGMMTNAQEMGQFGGFEKEINLSAAGLESSQDIILELFDYSAKDGSETDKVIIPLKFEKSEVLKIKVYFNNDNLDPEFSCNKVFPVEREIARTQAIAKAALEELLKGPTEVEKSQGYFTNINSGVKIQSIKIENKTAKADFDEHLEFQVGGSCRVAAIRAQIMETLKQFPTVDNVILSINGRTEDILQP